MAETAKVGKRMPTNDEWEKLIKAGRTHNMPLSGSRNWGSGTYSSQGSGGYYWSSSPNGANSYYASFYPGSGSIATNYYRAYGFSVRCVKH